MVVGWVEHGFRRRRRRRGTGSRDWLERSTVAVDRTASDRLDVRLDTPAASQRVDDLIDPAPVDLIHLLCSHFQEEGKGQLGVGLCSYATFQPRNRGIGRVDGRGVGKLQIFDGEYVGEGVRRQIGQGFMNDAPFGSCQGLHRDGAFHDIREMPELFGGREHDPQDLHENVHAVVPDAFDHDVAGVDISRVIPIGLECRAQLADEFPYHVVSDVSCAQGRQRLDGVEETRAVIKIQPRRVAYRA